MPATKTSLTLALASASPSALDRHSVHAVAIKLPEFCADNAHVWFAQTEAQFAVRNLTCSLTKFYYCIAALQAVLTQLRWWTSSGTLQMSYPMSPSGSTSPRSTPSTLSKGIRHSCPSPWLPTRSPPR